MLIVPLSAGHNFIAFLCHKMDSGHIFRGGGGKLPIFSRKSGFIDTTCVQFYTNANFFRLIGCKYILCTVIHSVIAFSCGIFGAICEI